MSNEYEVIYNNLIANNDYTSFAHFAFSVTNGIFAILLNLFITFKK